MGFNIVGNNNSGDSGDRIQVDYPAMNKEIVEKVAAEQPEVLTGVISGIIDAGIQPQPDAQYEFEGTAEDEAEEINKDPSVYFKTLPDYRDGGKMKRFKLKPVKPAQSVILTIDFPDVLVDKAKYFGVKDSVEAPYRMILGGEFTPSGGKTIAAKPLALTIRKNEKTNNQWSFPFNHTLYKMAVAAKLVKQGEPFLPQDIDKLLGQSMQFKIQVFLKDDKYLVEKCSFASALGRGQTAPELDPSLLSLVQFTVENDESAIKQLRASVKNTIRRAENFEGSVIQKQIGEGFQKDDEKEENQEQEEESVDNDVDDSTGIPFDDDIPFN